MKDFHMNWYLSWEDPLEEEMATQSRLSPGKSHREVFGGSWRAIVHGVTESQTQTATEQTRVWERLNSTNTLELDLLWENSKLIFTHLKRYVIKLFCFYRPEGFSGCTDPLFCSGAGMYWLCLWYVETIYSKSCSHKSVINYINNSEEFVNFNPQNSEFRVLFSLFLEFPYVSA